MKKGNFLVLVSGIKKKPFLITNVEKRDVVLDCTRVLSVPLWYKEVVDKICLEGVFKKKNYVILVITYYNGRMEGTCITGIASYDR